MDYLSFLKCFLSEMASCAQRTQWPSKSSLSLIDLNLYSSKNIWSPSGWCFRLKSKLQLNSLSARGSMSTATNLHLEHYAAASWCNGQTVRPEWRRGRKKP
ncbi:hypothetical protein AV530_018821 [Patagioenas fasciata monilis]|uniref:Uncharacterized protein n=1 Tax=Patagioenas fasciata monilis TaxID=372326 RepID=A0A1V4JJP2_PATFA|nr:hypothetical protein AV530_018821 [Patagioenas fasciata monilis]